MPIAGSKPTAPPIVVQDLPKVEPDNYKSIIYDNNHVPLQSLIAYVEGAPWTVTYYRQLVSKHNDLKEFDDSQDATYQQYLKINDLELRVDQGLSSSYDSENAITTTNGTAVVYPFLQVNAGDVFTAEASDNRRAILRVTNVERRTHNRDSAYAIEYTLIGYVDQKPQIVENLELKTVKEYWFSKQRLIEGLQPFIKSEEYENVTQIKVILEDIVQYYFRNMFNVQYSTLVIPGQDKIIFDSNLTGYIMKLVSTDDAPEVRRVKLVPTDNDPYLNQPDFWKLLFERDHGALKYCNDEMGLVSKQFFNINTFLIGFRYSNIDYLVYPDDPDLTLKLKFDPLKKPISSLADIIDTQASKGIVYTEIDNTYVDGVNTYKIIHDVLVDDKYVLSEAFYLNTDQQSLLEILTRDYMKGVFIDLKKLFVICNAYKKWKRLEQYYYGPILITLLLDAYRAQYT